MISQTSQKSKAFSNDILCNLTPYIGNFTGLLIFSFCRYLIVTKCEAVSPALEMEIKTEVKSESSPMLLNVKQEDENKSEVKSETAGIILKPKQEIVSKSAAQIVHEQHTK